MSHFYDAQGHGRQANGNYDPGAVSGQIQEHELVERLTGFIRVASVRCSIGGTIEACPDGPNRHSPNFAGTRDRANASQAGAVVEDHFDWSGAPEGGFGIHHPSSSQGKRLADTIRQAWRDHGLTVRATSARSNLGLLSGTTMPSVIWENGKVRHYPDAELRKMAEARVDGVCRYLGIPYVPPTTSAPTPEPEPVRTDNIDYVRYMEPRVYEMVRQPTVLWDFSAIRHADMIDVSEFAKGQLMTIVGKAVHPTGSRYLMTEYSFGDADVSGAPRATNGFNEADLEAVPETPGPAPEPEPVPDPVEPPAPAPTPPAPSSGVKETTLLTRTKPLQIPSGKWTSVPMDTFHGGDRTLATPDGRYIIGQPGAWLFGAYAKLSSSPVNSGQWIIQFTRDIDGPNEDGTATMDGNLTAGRDFISHMWFFHPTVGRPTGWKIYQSSGKTLTLEYAQLKVIRL